MKIKYYPGCSIKTNGEHFEISTRAVLEELGYELDELKRWTCCGTVYSLTSDDIMHHLAPVRNLLRVKEEGGDRVLTLCSMCYNTLKRVNLLIQKDIEKKDKIKDFMYKEVIEYEGDVEVIHLLQLFQEIGIDRIREKVKVHLDGLKVAPYYGCMLLRPEEVAIDDMENPSIFEDIIRLTGAEPVNFPYKNECCGSYQTLRRPDIVIERTRTLINSARSSGADMLLLTCPLCLFNLEAKQKEVMEKYFGFKEMPVIYFTQLLALAFGLSDEKIRFDLNEISPVSLLEKTGIFVKES
ncbi:CoB--CoM heterodisulfide reductase iron-sulfur subunit B family protein [candidate division WOR-3 bacterium]|nr:CoB--CoM heterodisulfide reductase iron-sulfur subunit B family protein [candidate division WOR-3 bacterium]